LFYTFIKKTLQKHFKSIELQMFPIATFYFRHFFILQGVPKKRIPNFIFGITLVIQDRF